MTLAVLGGTFDPVHIGHLVLAQEVREALGYDLVLLVPANIAPHKESATEAGRATPGQRLEMLARSIAGMPGLRVDDCELARGGVSYSVDTLEYVSSALRPDGLPGLVVGDDLLEGFGAWREPHRVATIADIIVAHRVSPQERPFPYRHRYVGNRLLQVTSSDIRRRIAAGLPVDLLVPPPAMAYIRERGLYGAGSAA